MEYGFTDEEIKTMHKKQPPRCLGLQSLRDFNQYLKKNKIPKNKAYDIINDYTHKHTKQYLLRKCITEYYKQHNITIESEVVYTPAEQKRLLQKKENQ